MGKHKFSDIAVNVTTKKMPVPEDSETYIGLEHMDSGSLSITRWGSKVVLKGQKLVAKKGDVLFGRRNAYLKRAAVAPFDCIFSAHGMILRPKDKVIDKDFFPLFIASDYFMNKAIEISVGSLSPTVNWGTLKDVEFDLPDMKDQKRIAELLWEIERERQSVSDAIKCMEQCKKSYLHDYIVPDGKSWKVKTIENAFTLLPSNSLSRNKLNNSSGPVIDIHYGDIHVALDDVVDVKNSYLTYVNEDTKIPKIKPEAFCRNGDVVIADASEDTDELGKAIELVNITDEKVLAGLHTFLCRPNLLEFAEGYLGYVMNSDYVHNQIEKYAVGTKIYSITKKDLLEVEIPIAPIDIQIKIVKEMKKMDDALCDLKRHEESTQELFRNMLNRTL
ncbi:restriction endonuclease subunit S [Clostridioides difficile]|nr:restriction endonuclease subunit S [Clostridioides difficile]